MSLHSLIHSCHYTCCCVRDSDITGDWYLVSGGCLQSVCLLLLLHCLQSVCSLSSAPAALLHCCWEYTLHTVLWQQQIYWKWRLHCTIAVSQLYYHSNSQAGELQCWVSGSWVSGSWVSGSWLSGSWVSGSWESGSWESGSWESLEQQRQYTLYQYQYQYQYQYLYQYQYQY